MISSWVDFQADQTDFQSHDVKNFISGKTATACSVVTSKTPANSKVILDIIFKGILPRAEVPRDLDIVPLPPGPFTSKSSFFLFGNFGMHIEQNLIVFVPKFVGKC